MVVLPHILLLAQTLNRALSPASVAKLDAGYSKVVEMLVVDRDNILGLPGSRTARNEVTHTAEKLSEPVMRMQNFLTEMFENLQHLLSHFSTNIGVEFYQQPNIGLDLCNTVLSHLPGLPDFRFFNFSPLGKKVLNSSFRLRAINKMFMKSFIQSCPSEQYNSVLLPVLSQV